MGNNNNIHSQNVVQFKSLESFPPDINSFEIFFSTKIVSEMECQGR